MFNWLRRIFSYLSDEGQPITDAPLTDRARYVLKLATREARRFNHEYVGTEHLLLGLVEERSGIAANVLKNLDIDLRKVRREVEKIVQHGPGGESVVMDRLPLTPRTKKVIDYSVEEARNLKHKYVGTEHLLLGLLREQEGVAAQVLMNLGLKLEVVREEILNLVGHNMPNEVRSPPNSARERAVAKKLTDAQLQIIGERIARLEEQGTGLTTPPDHEHAARCRAEAEALRLLLAWYVHFRDEE